MKMNLSYTITYLVKSGLIWQRTRLETCIDWPQQATTPWSSEVSGLTGLSGFSGRICSGKVGRIFRILFLCWGGFVRVLASQVWTIFFGFWQVGSGQIRIRTEWVLDVIVCFFLALTMARILIICWRELFWLLAHELVLNFFPKVGNYFDYE
jgi:hypothetical protein